MAVIKKISELTAKGSDIGANDLVIVGVSNGTDYDLKSVTGNQLVGAAVAQTITNGVTTTAPSQDAVFDALALKVDTVVGSRLITSSEATDIGYLSGVASNVQNQLNAKVNLNTLITPSTGTKVTYDAKGLILSSTNITTSDVSGLGTLATQSGTFSGTSSGTNTGDQTLQQVTNLGNETTTNIISTSLVSKSLVAPTSVQSSVLIGGTLTSIHSDGKLQINTTGSATGILKATNIANSITLEFPTKTSGSYTVATTSDFSGTNTGDQTFLNARVQTVTSSATVTPVSTNDLVIITAQAVGLTLANPTGTFTEGQALIIRVTDNGTARSIAYGTKFRGTTLPTTTIVGSTSYIPLIYNSTDDKFDNLSASGITSTIPVVIQLACSDETTALTTGTSKVTFRMPHAMTLTSVRASLNVAGTTSGITTIDINEGGTSILSTKLTIDLTEKTSTTAATPSVISDSSLADDAEITIDIDAISGGATEKGLKITLIGTRTI